MTRPILIALFLSLSASATTLTFNCLTNNSGTCPATVEPFFTVDINDAGGGKVQFLFTNSLPTIGRITTAFIDEGFKNFFSTFTVAGTPGTSFSTLTSGTLPGGNPPPYLFSTDHGAKRNGASANGVDPGETLDLRGTLNAGFTYSSVISGLATTPTDVAGLRVGLHVIRLPLADSEGLISSGTGVPEPGTWGLIGSSLGLLAWRRLRRKLS